MRAHRQQRHLRGSNDGYLLDCSYILVPLIALDEDGQTASGEEADEMTKRREESMENGNVHSAEVLCPHQ